MESLVPFVQKALYLLMAAAVIASAGVVLLHNLFYAALCLVAVLVATAALYISMHADFLAVVQILIYVGAVMTLVIFAIMLTQRLSEKTVKSHNGLMIPTLACATFLFFYLVKLILRTPWSFQPQQPPVTTQVIGDAFMTQYVFPFEVISVFLIAALVGAIVIAKKDKEE